MGKRDNIGQLLKKDKRKKKIKRIELFLTKLLNLMFLINLQSNANFKFSLWMKIWEAIKYVEKEKLILSIVDY